MVLGNTHILEIENYTNQEIRPAKFRILIINIILKYGKYKCFYQYSYNSKEKRENFVII